MLPGTHHFPDDRLAVFLKIQGQERTAKEGKWAGTLKLLIPAAYKFSQRVTIRPVAHRLKAAHSH